MAQVVKPELFECRVDVNPDFRGRSIAEFVPQGKFGFDRGREQLMVRILKHHANEFTHTRPVIIVNRNGTGRGRQRAAKQSKERRFSAGVFAENDDQFSDSQAQIDIAHKRARAIIREREIARDQIRH